MGEYRICASEEGYLLRNDEARSDEELGDSPFSQNYCEDDIIKMVVIPSNPPSRAPYCFCFSSHYLSLFLGAYD